MERRAAVDTGDVILAENDGEVAYVDAERIVVTHGSKKDEYELLQVHALEPGHDHPPDARSSRWATRSRPATCSPTAPRPPAARSRSARTCLVAFMSWEGYNFEDAIIISQRLVKDDELTSIHIEEYEIDARTTKLGDEEITRDIPNRSEESLRNLDERGIVRVGAEVASGDLLVGKVTPKGETELTAEEKLIRAIFKEKAREVRDTSLKVPHGEGGVVIDVLTFDRDAGDDLPPGVNNLVRVYVATKRKIAEGDKLAGRHGNKGVISRIVPEEDMPFIEDGTPVDVILNPLGVPSRMNIGQILETHLGWVAANGWYDDGTEAYKEVEAKRRPRLRRHAGLRRRHRRGRRRGARALAGRARRARGIDLGDRQEQRARGPGPSGTAQLYNGRTGEPYEGRVTIGYMYILKLLHLVDDKIHARSTGPYSLVTQQPLGGKAQFGGQRFGEMEVWALEAYGAAYTLQEMLTVKSDDTVGRVKAYESIVKSENIPEPSVPESFKVLLKEIQSLALDANLVAEEGEVELGEEDDELLRAAEELGIDLSGVRADGATAGDGAADEQRGAGGRRGRGREHERRRRRGRQGRGERPRRVNGLGGLDGHQQLRRDRDRPRLLEEDPELEPRRGHEAGDDQLPDAEAREGRALLRAHLRSDQGLGVLLRQVQAGPLQGHRLRALRRRGDPLQGPPRAHGPRRPGRSGLPHLVLQGRPEPDRLPDRHGSEGAREGPLLRRLDRHLDRRGGPRQGPRRSSRRRSRRSSTPTRPSASSARRSCNESLERRIAWLEGEGTKDKFDEDDELWADGARRRTRRSSRTTSATKLDQGDRARRSSARSPTPRPTSTTPSSGWRRSGRSSRR